MTITYLNHTTNIAELKDGQNWYVLHIHQYLAYNKPMQCTIYEPCLKVLQETAGLISVFYVGLPVDVLIN